MNALVRKEFRLLLPAWIAALALAIVPVWLMPDHGLVHWDTHEGGLACFTFALAAMLPSLAVFGLEFGGGTFPQLVAQPVSRTTLWRVKVGVVAVVLVTVFAAQVLSLELRIRALPPMEAAWAIPLICAIFGLIEFSGGLWTTLLLRQVVSAFWITIVAPFGFLLVVLTPLKLFVPHHNWHMFAALVVYAVAGFVVARRLFLRAQDTQWTGGTLSLPAWRRSGAPADAMVLPPRHRPLASLFRKEIQLHHVSLAFAGVLLVLHLLFIAIRKLNPNAADSSKLFTAILAGWFLLWLLLPFLIGGIAVAEERKLGTMEGFLCLPVRRRAQFAMKLGIALLLSVAACGAMPWIIEGIGTGIGLRDGPFKEAFQLQDLGVLTAMSMGLCFVSFYASTLARNTLQAIGTAFVLSMPLLAVGVWMFSNASDTRAHSFRELTLVAYVGLPAFLIAQLWLAYRNFDRTLVDAGLWRRNALALLLVIGGSLTCSALVYNRTWEFFMNLEPKHGSAQLQGPVRPKICLFQWTQVYVLLPDGRLWATTKYEVRRAGRYFNGDIRRVEDIDMPCPIEGRFVGASNWQDLASTYSVVLGIQSDGSLWSLAPQSDRRDHSTIPVPRRLGTDSNWKSVTAGHSHYLALKTDGTLWGAGENQNGPLGPGPSRITNDLVRVGNDSDWAAIFASGDTSIGVKRDGSVWKWGYLYTAPQGRSDWIPGPHPEPVRWNLDGSDWLEFAEYWAADVALRRDGTLWSSHRIPAHLLGPHYSCVTIEYYRLVGIRNGSLIQNRFPDESPFDFGAIRQPSKYSDWIALQCNWSDTMALAADGTMSYWWRVEGNDDFSLLGPTRKPLWSLNLLSAAPDQPH